MGLFCDIKTRSRLRVCDTANRDEKHRCEQSSPHEIILGKCDSPSKLLKSVDCRILNTATGVCAFTIFTIKNCDRHSMTRQGDSAKCAEIRGILRLLDSMLRLLAPLLLHSPVHELHSIEIKEHTNLFFLLTQKIEGVKHNCSLTVSEVFPVGAASGGQAKSPSAKCRSKA